MPFILLVGAAPNAIAYDSKQFTSGEFFMYGCLASVILMAVCRSGLLRNLADSGDADDHPQSDVTQVSLIRQVSRSITERK